ncbi:MAG: GNAT family N-acetyltransferase [Dehalococcoidales bacterium]|nr:MAG: GNAT family N-acetyltransferase [Dehalococcoidales bacterium]
MDILIRTMEEADIEPVYASLAVTGSNRPARLYERYYEEQENDQRVVLLAIYNGKFAGHANIVWKSEYPLFAEQNIPEISDLIVLPDLRRQRIATKLVDEAEKRIFKRSPFAGIGVGLYSDYGPAQRMYVLRGYVPDRLGLMYKRKPVKPMEMVKVDDDLVLYLVKKRPEK